MEASQDHRRRLMSQRSFELVIAGETAEKQAEDFYNDLRKKEELLAARGRSGGNVLRAKSTKRQFQSSILSSAPGTANPRASHVEDPNVLQAVASTDGLKFICTYKLVETLTAPGHEMPHSRSGHAGFMLSQRDSRLFIFGGAADDEYYNEIHILNVDTKRWWKSHTYSKPSPRSYSSLVVIGFDPSGVGDTDVTLSVRLLVFGGFRKGQIESDVYVLDTWDVVGSAAPAANKYLALPAGIRARDEPLESQLTNVWRRVPSRGDIPLGRCNHTAVLHQNNRDVVVFGGWHGTFVNDVYVLNTHTWVWTHKECTTDTGRQPKPRGSHSACILPDKNLMLILGGQNDNGMLNDLWVLDLTSFQWIKPAVLGFPPTPRSGHTMTYDKERRKVYVFGGFDGAAVKDDIHVLDVSKELGEGWGWLAHTVKGALIKGRTGHTACLVRGALYVQGGWSQSQFLDDVLKIEFEATGNDDAVKAGKTKNLEGTEDYALFMEKIKLLAMEKRDANAAGDALTSEAVDEMNRAVVLRLQQAQSRIQGNKVQALQTQAELAYRQQAAELERQQATRRKVLETCLAHGATQKEALAIANGYAEPELVERIVRRIRGEEEPPPAPVPAAPAPAAPAPARRPSGSAPPPPPPALEAYEEGDRREIQARLHLAAPTDRQMASKPGAIIDPAHVHARDEARAKAAAAETALAQRQMIDPLDALDEIIATGGGLHPPAKDAEAEIARLLDRSILGVHEALEDGDLFEDTTRDEDQKRRPAQSFRGLVGQMRSVRALGRGMKNQADPSAVEGKRKPASQIPLAQPSKEAVRPYRHLDIRGVEDLLDEEDSEDGPRSQALVPAATRPGDAMVGVVHIPGINLKIPSKPPPESIEGLVVLVQAKWKGYQARRDMRQNLAATKMQALARGFLARRRLERQGFPVATLERVRAMIQHAQRIRRYEWARLQVLKDLKGTALGGDGAH